jgi:hypothetical protein
LTQRASLPTAGLGSYIDLTEQSLYHFKAGKGTMGLGRLPSLAKFFVGMIFSQDFPLRKIEEALASRFGPVDSQSPLLPFTFTQYYHGEMGTPLWRRFIVFEDLIKRQDLITIKRITIELERSFSTGDEVCPRRTMNLDPRYLTPGQLVLATTKDRAHRVFLGDGIYADLHLLYHPDRFQPLDWSYPDYRAPAVLAFFSQARDRFHLQLKSTSIPQSGED